MATNRAPLDPYSTSQTKGTPDFDFAFPSPCIYGSPYIAFQREGKDYAISQGNCHHWDCPRCGIIRAKTEYWRIVQGCNEIVKQGKELHFITITTKGAGLPLAEAEQSYLLWTNRLLSNLRVQTARAGDYWCYVQVTERQKRAHPHSHILTTYDPHDAVKGFKKGWSINANGERNYEKKEILVSDKLQKACISAGLGEQYDYSVVRDSAAVSRYVGKYLFKQSLHTEWPKGWKRVRYSQNWPRSDFEGTSGFILLSWKDWEKLAALAVRVTCDSEETFDYASWKMRESDTIITKRKTKEETSLH